MVAKGKKGCVWPSKNMFLIMNKVIDHTLFGSRIARNELIEISHFYYFPAAKHCSTEQIREFAT